MKNTLSDLNNMMFEMLERLNDDESTDEQFEKEIKKSKAMCNVGRIIIDNAELVYKAKCKAMEYNTTSDDFLIGQNND